MGGLEVLAGGALPGGTVRGGGLHFRGSTKKWKIGESALRKVVEVAVKQVWRVEQVKKMIVHEPMIGGPLPLRAFADAALSAASAVFHCDAFRRCKAYIYRRGAKTLRSE